MNKLWMPRGGNKIEGAPIDGSHLFLPQLTGSMNKNMMHQQSKKSTIPENGIYGVMLQNLTVRSITLVTSHQGGHWLCQRMTTETGLLMVGSFTTVDGRQLREILMCSPRRVQQRVT